MLSRNRRLLPLAVAVLVGVPAPGVGYAEPSPQAAAAIARGTSMRTVTLITGDQVRVHQQRGQQVPVVEPGKGRDGVEFAVTRSNGHLYVVPSDATTLVGRGVLDRRLFDVTGLIAQGFHDAGRSDLPLLVQGDSADSVAPLADDAGGTVTRRLSAVDGVALRQPKRSTARLWSSLTQGTAVRSGVRKIWLDGTRKPLLDESVPQVGAPAAWRSGLTGKGVKVAVLDSGIDATHPDFKDRISAVRNFTTASSANDRIGHGTHVASIVAGTGAASSGRYKGVAPGAKLLIGKVCGGWSCSDSAILAGMQWAAQSGAKVVNISLGARDTPDMDPVEQAVNDLTTRYGTLFVISAGNSGDDGETVGSPASADAALAVGAVDKSDKIAHFSSRGPRVGDAALKPEITAPGVSIRAANAKDGELGEPGKRYTTLSGTSMSAPHVVGAAAILAQQHPTWDADELKAALVGSAKTDPTLSAYAQGAGRLDVARAVKQPGYATPAVISAGVAMWPHRDDQPITRTVTYHNPGSQPVTYQLGLRTMGPDGEPASGGMFTVSAESVAVPAGGTAAVQVTVDTRVHGADGYYSAWLTATAGTAKLTTPIAVNKEVESYNVTFNITDRSGAVSEDHFVVVESLDGHKEWLLYQTDGSVTLRLPTGRYHVLAFLRANDGSGFTLMTYPVYEVREDGTIDLDARTAKRISVKLFDRAAKLRYAAVGYNYRSDRFVTGAGVITSNLSRVSTAHLGPELPPNEMYSDVTGLWYVPDSNGGTKRSPRLYHLAYYEYGHLMTGFTRNVVPEELAAVRTHYHSDGSSTSGGGVWFPRPTEVAAYGSYGFGASFAIPFARTEYASASGVQWASFGFVGAAELEREFTTYQPGRSYREAWGNPVSGPGFTAYPYDGVSRDGNRIRVVIPTATDGSGHFGIPFSETGSMKLYRNGTKIGERKRPGIGSFTVPSETADYRLTVDAARTRSRYSTKLSCYWTFRSGSTSKEQMLPVMTVGFMPAVDLYNRAIAGKRQYVPVIVRRADDGPLRVSSLTVEVSFNDGTTWKKVRVTRSHPHGGWLADISHPTGKKYVSLRTRAVDNQGNAVKETIIRAYGLK
ncbi:MAG TPA: S8 family serine peptidase [Micromonosporaceae bacterium]